MGARRGCAGVEPIEKSPPLGRMQQFVGSWGLSLAGGDSHNARRASHTRAAAGNIRTARARAGYYDGAPEGCGLRVKAGVAEEVSGAVSLRRSKIQNAELG